MRYAVIIERGESSYGAYVPYSELISGAIEMHLESMAEDVGGDGRLVRSCGICQN